jgi:hypothetical protein
MGYLLLCGIALIAIKRRVPITRGDMSGRRERGRGRGREVDWSWLKRRSLVGGCFMILLTGMGNFVPSVWLPCKLGSYTDARKGLTW